MDSKSLDSSFNWATEFSPWKLADMKSGNYEHLLLQLGHGILSVETTCLIALSNGKIDGFNWATEFSPWKRGVECKACGAQFELQLGHGILSVETNCQELVFRDLYMLQLGHGILSVETSVQNVWNLRRRLASIGPRNSLRGNMASEKRIDVQRERLQLGHGILSVETINSNAAWSITGLLQLGHGILSVETIGRDICRCAITTASIGPRNSLRGNE